MIGSLAVKRRVKVMTWVIVAIFGLCSLTLFKIQVVDAAGLSERAEKFVRNTSIIPAPRGQILDSKGTVLAVSEQVYDVGLLPYLIRDYKHYEWVDQSKKVYPNATKEQIQSLGLEQEIVGRGPTEAAKLLAPLLGMDRGELGGKMLAELPYFVVKKSVDSETWKKIKALSIPGVQGDVRYERRYPNGNVAATVLGFTDDKQGIAGVEQTQDSLLQGTSGKYTAERGASGDVMPGKFTEVPPTPGTTVRLSIDADLNNFAQIQADATAAKYGADWVSIVVQEVGTGRILALADSGTAAPEKARNGHGLVASRAVQYTYEPGSVGKVVTFAAAMDQNKITPLSAFNVPYTITMPNGESFKDSHGHPTELLTATGVLAESSNTGTVQIGDRVTDKSRFEMIHKLGWGEKTGIEMPGETIGLVTDYKKWDNRQRYTTMFGQGIAVSPMQTTAMMATIANYGVRVPTTIIDGYVRPDGVEIAKEAGKPERVMKADTAATLLRMMESVTSDGGFSATAQIPGYRTGGKSGTTEILSGPGGSVGSFAGFAPAEKPRIACSVVVYRPKTVIWGGVVAGPAFSKVVERALRNLNVPPSSEPAKFYPKNAKR